MALRFLLAREGWDVTTAVNIATAFAALRAGPPDVIVLDLMLPDGDGIDVLRTVRATARATRVAVVTGVNDPSWLQRVGDLQPDCLLLKPIKIAELVRCLDR